MFIVGVAVFRSIGTVGRGQRLQVQVVNYFINLNLLFQHQQPLTPAPVKQPQSILKDPSRHKYGNQYGSPISSSTPQSNSSQILTVQNLTSDVPQYGTIRKENKKQNVTIDESYNKRSETHVV